MTVRVRVVSTGPGCVKCAATTRTLNRSGLAFDVTEDAVDRAFYGDQGVVSAPVVEVHGDDVSQFASAHGLSVVERNGETVAYWSDHRPDHITALAAWGRSVQPA